MKACALLLGASALALAFGGPAARRRRRRQTTAPVNADTEQDIIITATRRDENLMTSPISASVLSGTDLSNKGVTNVDALQFAMPSVVVNNFGQGNDFNVRGIGKAEHNTQTTTGVITYRDGVPTFPGYFQMEPYYDVANIQVLRGPQGTIVGQNATGGAVFVNTNDPIINGGMHGYVNANYGNYNDFGFQGAINMPISDTLRGARRGVRRAPRQLLQDQWPGRHALSVRQRQDGLSRRPRQLPVEAERPLLGVVEDRSRRSRFGRVSGVALLAAQQSVPERYKRDLYNIELNAPQDARDKFIRSVLKLEYDTPGGIKFRSVTGYQTGNTMYRADLDGTARIRQPDHDHD